MILDNPVFGNNQYTITLPTDLYFYRNPRIVADIINGIPGVSVLVSENPCYDYYIDGQGHDKQFMTKQYKSDVLLSPIEDNEDEFRRVLADDSVEYIISLVQEHEADAVVLYSAFLQPNNGSQKFIESQFRLSVYICLLHKKDFD